MTRLGLRLLFCFLVATTARWARAQDNPRSDTRIAQIERLSVDLRGRRLTPTERRAIERSFASEPGNDYEDYVERWLTKDALKAFLDPFIRAGMFVLGGDVDAEVLFHRLNGRADVYWLPHQPACSPEEAVEVKPWWQEEPVRVCSESYRPDVVFDELGYCSGEAEPFMRQPPREACGCGPSLIGCLPPIGEYPGLDKQVRESIVDEWFETAARIVAEGSPLDELMTTTRTWQSGLVEFVYLRRELLRELHDEGWSEPLDASMKARIEEVDLRNTGRWVEREGIYEGSGLWWSTVTVQALKLPVRNAAHAFLTNHLCSSFDAVNVDADAILKAVGSHHENLRTLSSILATPMRTQSGCKGCHAPMDGAVGFMTELQASMYGYYPSGLPGEGELFVTGASDFRGKGNGMSTLAALAVAQPEFETCSVRRAFEEVLQRDMKSYDEPLFEELIAEFRTNGHRWRPIIAALLKSDSYLHPSAGPSPVVADTPSAIPDNVTVVIRDTCVACHNETHFLDLSKLPPATETELWTRVLVRVSDLSMPPPSHGETIEERFPLEPSVRHALTESLAKMLASSLDTPDPPRRLPHRAWMQVAHELAEDTLGAERVDGLLERSRATGGYFALTPRGQPLPYQVVVERTSEDLCREIARVQTFSVDELLLRVYGRSPTEAEIRQNVDLLSRFRNVTDDDDDAWVGLCSTHLSSPRMFFELYAEGKEMK